MFIRTTSHAWKHKGRNLAFHVGPEDRQHRDATEALTLHSDSWVGKVRGSQPFCGGTEVFVETQERGFS